MTVDQIIKYCGSKTKAKDRFGYTLQTLRNWRKQGIPLRAQRVIEQMTDGELKATKQ